MAAPEDVAACFLNPRGQSHAPLLQEVGHQGETLQDHLPHPGFPRYHRLSRGWRALQHFRMLGHSVEAFGSRHKRLLIVAGGGVLAELLTAKVAGRGKLDEWCQKVAS